MSRPRAAVVPTIAHLARVVRGLHLLQAVFVGVAAACLVQAAAALSGAAPFGTDGWALGIGLALAAGLCWWRGHPVAEARLARRVDRALGARGELETAWEAERRGGRLAPALTRRALVDVEGQQLLRAAVPDSTLAIAAPLLAASLLALALETTAPDAAPAELAGLAASLAAGLDAAERSGSDPGHQPSAADAPERRLVRAAAAARTLAERSQRRPELAPELVAEAESLFEELERLARETPTDAPWRRSLDAARNAAEALRDAVAASGAGAAGEDQRAEPEGSDSDAGRGLGGGGGPPAVTGTEPSAAGASGSAPRPSALDVPPLDLGAADALLVDAWTRTAAANR